MSLGKAQLALGQQIRMPFVRVLDVPRAPVEGEKGGGRMTDAELIALAAFVNGMATEAIAANDTRKVHGQAMCYDGFPCPEALESLEIELRRRGIIQTRKSTP